MTRKALLILCFCVIFVAMFYYFASDWDRMTKFLEWIISLIPDTEPDFTSNPITTGW